MKNKVIGIIISAMGLLSCAWIVIMATVPRRDLQAFGQFLLDLFSYTLLATSVLLVVALLIGVSFLILFVGSRGFVWWQEGRKNKAGADKEVFESQYSITVAAPGSDTYIHKMIQGQGIVTDPLHLAAGRVNGVPADFGADAIRMWQFRNAMQSINHAGKVELLQSGDPLALPAPELPNLVRLIDLLPGLRGSMHNLILGQRINEYGQLVPVTISIHDLFHTIVAASSGWGKSAFASSILAQLLTGSDPVEVVLIDQQDHGLAAFKQCDRLRYPLLREPGEILGALREIHQEATMKRSELFARYDADNLAEYNRLADEPLSPIIVAVDEASALLNSDKTLGTELKRQTWELRKFGVYQILCLTSAKGTVIDTDHRQQFSSKVQLHANDKNQARLLMDATEAITFPPGRAMIDLPGQPAWVVQTPYIDKREVRNLLRPAAVKPAAPPIVIEVEESAEIDRETRIIDLIQAGAKDREIAEQVFNKPNLSGDNFYMVKRLRRNLLLDDNGALDASG